jgi:hypothetical protein
MGRRGWSRIFTMSKTCRHVSFGDGQIPKVTD